MQWYSACAPSVAACGVEQGEEPPSPTPHLHDDRAAGARSLFGNTDPNPQEGAREVYACTSHAVFSPPAIERLSSGVFEEVIVTNTIPVLPVRASVRLQGVQGLLAGVQGLLARYAGPVGGEPWSNAVAPAILQA